MLDNPLASCLVRQVRLINLRQGESVADVTPLDVRVVAGTITEIGARLRRRGGEQVQDADGLWALPGLWDQHVHLGQWAALSGRLDLSGAASVEQACALVAEAVSTGSTGGGGSTGGDGSTGGERSTGVGGSTGEIRATIQGFGHRPATWSSPPTVAALDAASGTTPVVLISGDAHHGWLNTAALTALRLPSREGVIEEAEWFALFPRLAELPGAADDVARQLPRVLAAAAARGVTGIVDLEFADNPTLWPPRVAAGLTAVRVRAGFYPDRLAAVLASGLRTGDPLPDGAGLATLGPLKIITDGSLNTRTAWCCEPYADHPPLPYGKQNVAPTELDALLAAATAHGLEVAVHAIGDAAVRDALDCFAATGARGSIEHAQLIKGSDLRRMAELGIRASVQPAHLLDDREVSQQCWPDRMERCFRFAGMLDAGVTVVLGSDAPVSPLDPWLAMAAAVHRGQPDQEPWQESESLSVRQALACSTDGVTALRVGGPGDLVLTPENPLLLQGSNPERAAALREWPVTATIAAGTLTHSV